MATEVWLAFRALNQFHEPWTLLGVFADEDDAKQACRDDYQSRGYYEFDFDDYIIAKEPVQPAKGVKV